MSITLFDVIVITVVLVSAILAMVRGFVREVLAIASWLIAAVATFYLYEFLRDAIQPYIENETLATIISVAVIFIIVLVIVTYLTMKLADVVIDSRIGSFDRLFGFVFGALRGLLLIVVAYVLFDWLVEEQPAWIADAETRPIVADLSDRLIEVLPQDVEDWLLNRRPGEETPATDEIGDLFPGNDEGAAVGDPDRDRLEQVINANAAP